MPTAVNFSIRSILTPTGTGRRWWGRGWEGLTPEQTGLWEKSSRQALVCSMLMRTRKCAGRGVSSKGGGERGGAAPEGLSRKSFFTGKTGRFRR